MLLGRLHSMCKINTAGLFLSHKRNRFITYHYRKLVRETRDQVRWRMLFDPSSAAKGFGAISRRAHSLTPHRHAEVRLRSKVSGGLLDVPIMAAAALLDRDYVWCLEYDVDWSGNWADFFRLFGDNDADLLTTTVYSREATPDWPWWRSAASPDRVAASGWLRAFHPVMRISRRLIACYAEEMADPAWEGHYEFLLPTIARHHGLTVEDMGGDGPFVPPAQRRRLYGNDPSNWTMGPGTFVWRPSLDRYAWQGGGERVPDTLYHPVKAGVGDWEAVERRNEDAFSECRAPLRYGRITSMLRAACRLQPGYLLHRLKRKLLRSRPCLAKT